MTNKLFYKHWTILCLLIFNSNFVFAKSKSIYGEDNRHLILEESIYHQRLGKAVAAQVDQYKLLKSSLGIATYRSESLRSGLNFCSDERFNEMPSLSDCSGVLVADDLILTAGHCMEDKTDCTNKSWVFDFDHQSSLYGNEDEVLLAQNKIYKCQSVVSFSNEKSSGNYIDYALIKLDRKVTDRDPLPIKRVNFPKVSKNVAVIGHPLGMPKVMVDGITTALDFSSINQKIDSDTFSGNSGSPLIDLNSGSVVGILIRGDVDLEFDIDSGCNRIKKCVMKKCKGETFLNYGQFPSKLIPFKL